MALLLDGSGIPLGDGGQLRLKGVDARSREVSSARMSSIHGRATRWLRTAGGCLPDMKFHNLRHPPGWWVQSGPRRTVHVTQGGSCACRAQRGVLGLLVSPSGCAVDPCSV
jgi:hypothetical protein